MKEPVTYKEETVAIQHLLLPIATWVIGMTLATVLLILEPRKKRQHQRYTFQN